MQTSKDAFSQERGPHNTRSAPADKRSQAVAAWTTVRHLDGRSLQSHFFQHLQLVAAVRADGSNYHEPACWSYFQIRRISRALSDQRRVRPAYFDAQQASRHLVCCREAAVLVMPLCHPACRRHFLAGNAACWRALGPPLAGCTGELCRKPALKS